MVVLKSVFFCKSDSTKTVVFRLRCLDLRTFFCMTSFESPYTDVELMRAHSVSLNLLGVELMVLFFNKIFSAIAS
jgi:hypothetical protein